ncbi:hypothetical protein [Bacillus sp. B1-b2]|uniref:hypothetical protein n=1 Tax=Bacillus sp. B1-b2 TaxID=2653201 RepID=UPI001261F903|nr:hypothetical protein [Bacillus sp. B1-b2]KAB7672021.1 hypothetical protein F9279_03605 [Bacillus sp. B1-b2]
MLKLFKKRWQRFDQAVHPYKPYVTVPYGVTTVSPKDIIALKYSPKEFKKEEAWMELRKSIEIKGWSDIPPSQLHLYYLPNGKFVASEEGNQLSYLSDELEIPSIQASVSILIPEEYLPENMKKELDDYAKKEYYTKKREEMLLSFARFVNLTPNKGTN